MSAHATPTQDNGKASFALRARNPDVLSCIANLSSDEVFTPPEMAKRMLDSLAAAWAASNSGADLWADPTVRFLDPCAKSGVFLREIASRLVAGLEAQMPDLQERVDHVLTKQVFGMGITHLTSLLARRSLYCSKHADGMHSIASAFRRPSGNVWFERVEHTWKNKRKKDTKCIYCGTPRQTLDRGQDAETHAYALIHTDNVRARVREIFPNVPPKRVPEVEERKPTQENEDPPAAMQFDVIIANPPYQLEDGGHGASAAPIYHLFVEQALQLDPRFAVFVTPSRWMTGGKGLSGFRGQMLGDKRLRAIVDYPKLYEAFPGVKIRGGVSYFVWEKDYHGPCHFQTVWDGEPTGPAVERHLDAYDVLVRRNEAVPILEKVLAKKEPTLDARVSSARPFGLRTYFHGKKRPTGMAKPVKFFGSRQVTWVERSEIPSGTEWIGQWKVLMTAVQGTSAAIETKFLSKPIVAGPGTACSETYLVAGAFGTQAEAENYAEYLSTRFVRFLVSLRKVTQHATQGVYGFVPDLGAVAGPGGKPQGYTTAWTDAMLYARYGLTEQEIAFIESQVAKHEA